MVKRAFSSFSFLSASLSLLALSAISSYLLPFTAFMPPPSLPLSKSLYRVKKIFSYDNNCFEVYEFPYKNKIKLQCADIYQLYRHNNISYDYILLRKNITKERNKSHKICNISFNKNFALSI